jgi:signal transduction histidine kinase/DNA-binding response OmpR family regulator
LTRHTEDGSDFLKGGGELGALIRRFDWTSTELGDPGTWPESLKIAIRIMLTSRQPIWIGWGPQLIYFYNDAYKSIIGGKHPWALGRPTREVWAEIWDDIGPMLGTAMRGEEGTFAEEQLLIMERNGYREETYYTFSYSPIPAEDGSAGGIICANSEDTGRVFGERQLALLRELGAGSSDARTWEATREAVEHALCTNPHDITFALLYMPDETGADMSLAACCHITADHPAARASDGKISWPMAETLADHTSVVVTGLTERFNGTLPQGAWSEPSDAAAVVPLPMAGDLAKSGILVVGLNPFRLYDANYSGFLNLVANQVSAAFANAAAYEQERMRAEKLAELDLAKTAFFSNISHEFRTPLTLMLGPLEEVLSKSEQDVFPDNRRLVDIAHRNGIRLMRLVNSLLDFSRIEAGRVEARYRPTDLAAFTADLASSFRSATDQAGLELVIATPTLSRDVYVDRDMWEKVVLNLISNAFKFTMEGSIRVDLAETGDHVRLMVRDTGIGIAEEDLPKLFERFQRVEGAKGRSFEGSGIGLALVQELVRLHAGEVTVESAPGNGSAFSVTIPLGREHLPADHVEERNDATTASRATMFVEEALRWLPGAEMPRDDLNNLSENGAGPARFANEARSRILLADDNADMRGYVARLLASRYDVEAVADGQQALDAIARSRPDLVLTDVMMPRLDGFELLHHIRDDETLRDLPVVMLSARAGEEAQVEGLEAGADDYLIKPFSARELVARVSANLEMARSRREAQRTLETLNAQLSAETARLSKLFEDAPSLMAVLKGPDHIFELANPAYLTLVGNRAVVGKPLRAALPEIVDQGFPEILDRVRETGEPFVGDGVKVLLARGEGGRIEERVLDFVYQPIAGADGEVSGVFVEGSDVTDRVRAENLRAAQNRILEATVEESSLGEALERLVRVVEDLSPSGALCSVLLLSDDGQHLRHGAAPSLPSAYNQAIDGMEIGSGQGSCGTAAFERRPVYVADIGSDPLWAEFRALAFEHGLRACWSTPILGSNESVLGTFAVYYDEPREAAPSDMELIAYVARSASLLIERKRAEQALRDQTRILQRLNRTGVRVASELDRDHVVQMVTDAGVELTGAQFGAFFYNVLDAAGESYMLYALSGVDRSAFERFPMPRNTAVFAPTFGGTAVVRSDDITTDECYGRNAPRQGMPEGHLPVRSYLAVPVISRSGEVIGGLFFGHAETAQFSADHEQLMLGIAAQAAIAIDNARLFDAAQREVEERRVAEHAVRELNQSLEQRIADAVAEREAIEDVLRQAQKMEAVGQLTGGIAHDFNNLLTIITGNMDMALRAIDADGAIAPKLRRAIGNAQKGAERAAALTQRLLAFSRRQPLAPKALDADKLIFGMSEMLKRALGETVHLETVTAPGLWRVEADPNQLESALLNLAVNARDAMPSGGKLTVETANARLDEVYSAGHAEVAPGDYVVIAVSDTGQGMSRETLARVFEPFFTTKEVGKGTGLGLSMVYGFVKQSGGHVKIYSEEGEGSTVKIYLPRMVGEVIADEALDETTAAQGTQGETILVVEDDDDVRAYTVEILRELGYRVLEAHDGPAALRLIERVDVAIDLLFTDVVMPEMSGRELSDQAHLLRPHLKVLYTSGYTRNAIVHGGRLDPGVQIVAKPFTFDELAAKVREMLDTRTSGRVLLVNHDAGVRMLTAEALMAAGYATDEVTTAGEALGKIRASRGSYGAVIIDCDLPDRRGKALVSELRALQADLPLLLVLAKGGGQPDEPFPNDRCTLSIAKPYNMEALQNALRELGARCTAPSTNPDVTAQ